MNQAVKKLQTQTTFNEREVRELQAELGIIGELPSASIRGGGEPLWSRDSIIKWGKRSPRCRPAIGILTR